MKKKKFSEKFYEVLKVQNDGAIEGCLTMPKERFIAILDEEIMNYGRDTHAEVGMGIYRLIEEKRKDHVNDYDILEIVIKVCTDLISKSPESAMEFASRLKRYDGTGM